MERGGIKSCLNDAMISLPSLSGHGVLMSSRVGSVECPWRSTIAGENVARYMAMGSIQRCSF